MGRITRRRMLQWALGASQVGLLHRFGLTGRSRAALPEGGPTKFLGIHMNGGCHWETFFCPLSVGGINTFIPAPTGNLHPLGYAPGQVQNFDQTPADLDAPGPVRPVRGPIYWNWADPNAKSGNNPLSGDTQAYRPYGYIWANPAFNLFDKTCVLIGADQNTASHASGIVASMCGVAGSNFRAPSVHAVIANALAAHFDRPLPNVYLDGFEPKSLDLPAIAAPARVSTLEAVEPTLSDARDDAWSGLRARTELPNLALDGTALGGTVPATPIDAAVMEAFRGSAGYSTAASDAYLESIYETTKGASRTIARDLLSVLQSTQGFEHLYANPLYASNDVACIGYADTCGQLRTSGPWDFALQLLKSDLVTSVNVRAKSISNFSFDTHTADGPRIHTGHLRIALEMVGRMLVEMDLTPSGVPGRSLLDDTLVYIYSEFGRTFPKQGSDHHPATAAILVGGGIHGNQMIGGYDETMTGSPMGVPVPIIEETGDSAFRRPRSQDVAATVLRGFGLEANTDFFIPGGYGWFEGVFPWS